jgi:hypothetical protein
MLVKTISSTVTMEVVIGKRYGSPLTITDTGSVAPTKPGATAIDAPATLHAAEILNQGFVTGGMGATASHGGTGGTGINMATRGAVTNQGHILGGAGGYGYYGGGTGGIGLMLADGGRLNNAGIISGGLGHATYNYYAVAGAGGIGVDAGSEAHLLNTGAISGGAGGQGYIGDGPAYGYCGAGAVGVVLGSGAILTNRGAIRGGDGGSELPYGNNGDYYGHGGSGAAGIELTSIATIASSGTITGGNGGDSSYTAPGTAGSGIDMLAGGIVANSGMIVGGAGGGVTYSGGGTGGAGVDLANAGTLTNTGTIVGGAGGYSLFAPSGSGGVGVYLNGGTLTNAGTIAGGNGGAAGYAGYPAGPQGDSVLFGSQAATLTIDPNAVFGGDIVANSNVNDTLVLAGKSHGVLSGLGSSVAGFTSIDENAGANWQLNGTISGKGAITLGSSATLILNGLTSIASLEFGAGGDDTLRLLKPTQFTSNIAGFGTGDVIALPTLDATSLTYQQGTLSLLDAHQDVLATLDFAGNYVLSDFTLEQDAKGVDVVYAGAAQSESPYGVRPDAQFYIPHIWYAHPTLNA